MIELDEFEFKAKECFRLMFWTHAVKALWVWAYLTIFMCAGAIVLGDWMFPVIFSVVLAITFLVSSYFEGRYYAYSKENNAVFQKRRWTFGNSTYHIVCEDGTEAQGPLSHIYKADIWCDCYCIFVSNMMYYPIPFSAFRSEEDRIRFETEILGDKLKTKAIPWKKILVFLLVSAFLIGLALLLRGTPKIVKPNISLDNVPPLKNICRNPLGNHPFRSFASSQCS